MQTPAVPFEVPYHDNAAQVRRRPSLNVARQSTWTLRRALHTSIDSLRWHGLPASTLHLLGRSLELLAAALQRRAASWSNRRALTRSWRELQGLDAQTLRDLGMSRSEAQSLALEAARQVEATRLRTLQLTIGSRTA